ncbi:MAG TPA: hypothetical protein VFD46_05670 [Chryseolinea sp.]|nr:hypothetical protein [Chryseolinea sp.]
MKKNPDSSFRFLYGIILVLITVNCSDNPILSNQKISSIPRGDIFDRPGRDLPEGIPESENWQYPYPNIISREFIPSDISFANTKCLAWRITWPEYENTADVDKIPTVFGINGALSSFDYLNSVHPGNTLNKVFSLHYDTKIKIAVMLWAELEHTDILLMDVPQVVMSDQPLENIIYWVTERPSLFKIHWPAGADDEVDYSEGDIIQFYLSDADLYGGIRIVSMTPRIIEVYLAVPNL